MIKEIRMPKAGQTTDAAVIVEWKVKLGDKIQRGDVLLEAETDKAILPVESFAAGIVIDILAKEGETVEGGDVVCIIGDAKDAASYSRSSESETAQTMQDQVVPQEEQDDGFIPIMKRPLEKPELPAEAECFPAMPNSKRLAKELGVNLGTVKPANGMYITRQDVLAAAKDRPHDALGYTVMPMGRMRKAIARRMLESVSTIPSFQVTISVDARQLLDLKKQLEVLRQTKVSYNDIITKALSVVAKDFPLINARYEHDEIRVYEHTNVGLAVAIEDGLIVPVIRNVDMLSIQDIAKISRALIEKARKGALLADEMGSGSVTISNLGMYGIDHFTAIVNPPESAIFAIGSIEMKPFWDGSGFKPVEMMTITGSFDHRIIDGAYAARLLNALRTLLEHPVMMFT